MRSIILKLSGPLQSYGTDGFGTFRYTDTIPSKSAVIGMVAAALGYKRGEEEKLQRLLNLEYAVRVDREGRKTKDFQTMHTAKGHTYVINRYYMEDALYMAAIGSEDEELMDRIEKALKHCVYAPVLGRRSCPAGYDFMFGVSEKDPVGALANLPWQGKRGPYPEDTVSLKVYADACLLPGCESYPRQDLQESFKRHTMTYRLEAVKDIAVPVEKAIEDQLLNWDYS